MKSAILQCTILAILLAAATTTVTANDAALIPEDATLVSRWFETNVQPYSQRKGTLNSTLEAAEANPKIIRVRKDGSGDFTTLTDAIKSVPVGNTQRVIIDMGPGIYHEKVEIVREKPFITLHGSKGNMPTLSYNGTAKEFGTFYSATLQVKSQFFVASNIIFENTAPRPNGKSNTEQAVALRIGADYAAFYNCRILGFQDTLLDHSGKHFYKDCYIQGTVDFIFGNAKSIFLGTEIHVFSEPGVSVITAHGRKTQADDTGFSFVHCSVTGVGSGALLGRAWMEMPRVVFSYSHMAEVVDPVGWSDNFHPERDHDIFYGEYRNTGPGANLNSRVRYAKPLSKEEITQYISLSFIEGSKWLLPPPNA